MSVAVVCPESGIDGNLNNLPNRHTYYGVIDNAIPLRRRSRRSASWRMRPTSFSYRTASVNAGNVVAPYPRHSSQRTAEKE